MSAQTTITTGMRRNYGKVDLTKMDKFPADVETRRRESISKSKLKNFEADKAQNLNQNTEAAEASSNVGGWFAAGIFTSLLTAAYVTQRS